MTESMYDERQERGTGAMGWGNSWGMSETRQKEHRGRGKAPLRVTGKEFWVYCEWGAVRSGCLRRPDSLETSPLWSRRLPTLHNGTLSEPSAQIFTDVIITLAHGEVCFSPPRLKLLPCIRSPECEARICSRTQRRVFLDLTVQVLTQIARASNPFWTVFLFLFFFFPPPTSPHACPKNSGQIFSEEIMKFLKLLGRGTLNHPFSLPFSVDLAPVSAPQLLPVWAWGKHLLHWALYSKRLFWGNAASLPKRLLVQVHIWGGEARSKKKVVGDCLKHFASLYVPFGSVVTLASL